MFASLYAGITIESFYPIGVFRCWTHIRFRNQILVYPSPLSNDLILKNKSTGEEESLSLEVVSGINDFEALKNYEEGESLNRVAWKLVAKGGDMMTKQFSDSYSSTIWIDLSYYYSDNLETALSKMTWLVIELTQRQINFGLKLEEIEISPDTGNNHMEICLRTLATFKNPIGQPQHRYLV